MSDTITALWTRYRPCTGLTIALAIAAGVLLLDAAVAVPDEYLPVVAVLAIGLHQTLSRRLGNGDACCEGC